MSEGADPSQPERKWPARFLLNKHLNNLLDAHNNRIDHGGKAFLLNFDDDEPTKDVMALHEVGGEAPLVPIKIKQIDHARIDMISREFDGYTFVNLSAFSDGSPFAFEGDNLLDGRLAYTYWVVCPVEGDPFIVSQEIEGLSKTSFGNPIKQYLETLKAKGEKPRFLDDEEAQSVVIAVDTTVLQVLGQEAV